MPYLWSAVLGRHGATIALSDITGEPNELVAQIHTRMPVILPEEDHAKWLGETEDGDLKALLKPFPSDQMRIWPISPRVNSPINNDADIIAEIHLRWSCSAEVVCCPGFRVLHFSFSYDDLPSRSVLGMARLAPLPVPG